MPVRFITGPISNLHRWFLRISYRSAAFSFIGKPLAKAVYVWRLPGSRFLLPPNPLFDVEHYSASNPDLPKHRDLWAHYLAFGADERRNPHPLFATDYYLKKNPDVRASGCNALVHYAASGARENRRPHPNFDPVFYLMQRPDLANSRINPLLHYWECGRQEGYHAVRSIAALRGPRPSVLANPSPQSSNVRRDPVFSILLPTFNTPPEFLRTAIDSVLRQTYSGWQLCIYDDASSREDTLAVVREYGARGDPKITVKFGEVNLGIAGASNAALALAQAEYAGMLDHDDELDLDALKEVADLLRRNPSLDVVYTDQDYVDIHGQRTGTLLKPDWSPELFRGVMFVNHLLVVRTELMRSVGGFDPAFDRIQDFEFMLRVSEKTAKIGHVRRILYHWRSAPGSVAAGANSKGVLEPLQAAAVNAQLSRSGINAIAAPHPSLSHRLILSAAERSSFPKVIVAIRDVESGSIAQTALSILDRSTYPNLLVCVPASQSTEPLGDQRVCSRNLEDVHRQLANDEFLVWIDGDLEIITPDWIETLLAYCEQSDVACVSPLIVREGSVWSAGLVLGINESIGYIMRGLPAAADGYAGSLSCSREVSAVSGESMMISGAMFRHLGGNVKYYASSALDGADLAMRGLTAKMRNIVTPRAALRKHGPFLSPRGWKLDEELFADRWRDLIRQGDPFYNSNFLAATPGYALEAAAAGSRL